jgi:cobalt transporter subunit CbtB
MQNQAIIHAGSRIAVLSKGFQLVTALMLGMVILYGAGFVQMSAAHNAAHDMRHAIGFPCH